MRAPHPWRMSAETFAAAKFPATCLSPFPKLVRKYEGSGGAFLIRTPARVHAHREVCSGVGACTSSGSICMQAPTLSALSTSSGGI